MRRSFRFMTLICAAMSIIASCAKEEVNPDSGKPAGPEPDQTFEYVFAVNNATLTRATLSDKTILLEEGDKLGVIAVTPEKTTTTEADAFYVDGIANIAFEITQKKGIEKDGRVYAFYPVVGGSENTSTPSDPQAQLSIPAQQSQTEAAYDADAMPLVSVPFTAEATLPTGRKNEAGQLTMTAVGAVAEFEIYSTFPGFESQEIVAVEWEAEGLAGDFTWDFASENPALGTLTGKKVTTAVVTDRAVAATKAEAAKIYMVVAPGQHTGTVKVTTVAGEYTLTLAEALTLEAGKVTPIEVNLENTTWSESKIYRYRFAATAADELFGGLTQTIGFFAGEENIEKTLAEDAFTYDLNAPLAADASFYAYYPYNAEAAAASALTLCIPAEQTNPAEGGYDKSYIPVVAAPVAVSGTANTTEPNGTFEFHSLASVLKLNFFSANAAATEEELESVTLVAAGAAGNFTWDLTAAKDTWTFSGLDAESVTAVLATRVAIGETAEKAASVYLVLAPGTYNGVLTVKTNHTSYELPLNAELTRAATKTLDMELPTSAKGFGATLEEFEIVEFPTTFSDGATADMYGIDQQKTTITFSEGGFEAEDHVKGPFYAVYPEGAGSVNFNNGTFSGTVAAEQTLAEGKKSVDNAFAYFAKSNSPALAFKNATSLVKVAVLNENVSAITLTAKEGQSIAGDYTLTITEDNVSVAVAEGKGASSITLKPAGATFAKGEYYVAVIPGATENLTVNFTIGEETATKTRTIETIARNTAADLGKFLGYDIANAQELLAWNNDAANWTKWDIVTLTDNIDCAGVITSENWAVRNFSGTLDGNNKTIRNLVIEKAGPAAFFGRVSNATITDLTFDETCSFTTTGTTGEAPSGGYAKNRMYAASLLCDATAGTTLRNITNHARVDATTTSASNGNYIGGICAYFDSSVGATNCKNYGHVSYSSATTGSWVNVSGCFGHTTKDITLEGCENHGLVQFLGTNSGNKSLNLAGIAGGANTISFKNCKNDGKIECKATAKHSGGTNIGGFVGLINSNVTTAFENCENTSNGILINSCQSGGTVAIGGSIGYITGSTAFSSKVSISNFKNYGTIQNAASVSGTLTLGGIAGMMSIASENHISSCENHGEVKNSSTCYGNIYIGGIVGGLNNASTNISNVTNKGNITNQNIDATTINKIIAVGGIAGYAKGGSGNSITKATNSAAIKPCSAETDAFVYAGGIVGCIESGNTSVGDATANGVSNSGDISWGSKTYDSGVGGIVGKIIANSTNTIQNCKNTGNISHTNWLFEPIKNVHGWGGILGCHTIVDTETAATLNVSSCINEGKITKTGGSVCHIHIGGISGSIGATNFNTSGSIANPKATEIFLSGNGTANIQSCTNKGAISNTWTSAGNYKYSYTGGIAGYFNYDGELLNCENLGNVSCSVASNGASHIALGGIVGRSAAARITDCTNNALVTEGSTTAGGYVGGIVGRSESTRALTLTNCDNKQAISVNFSSNGDFRVGGIIGIAFKDITLDGCDNSGDITVNTTKTSGGQYLGGLIGQSENNLAAIITNCSCKATLKPTTTLSLQYSGMIAGRITDKNNPAKSSVSNTTVAGTFNGTPLDSSNFTTYCFGSNSNFKATSGITLAQ